MNKVLYLNNKLHIYRQINEKQNLLLELYRDGLLLNLQWPIDYEKYKENKEKIKQVKNEIQRLYDRIVLLTL